MLLLQITPFLSDAYLYFYFYETLGVYCRHGWCDLELLLNFRVEVGVVGQVQFDSAEQFFSLGGLIYHVYGLQFGRLWQVLPCFLIPIESRVNPELFIDQGFAILQWPARCVFLLVVALEPQKHILFIMLWRFYKVHTKKVDKDVAPLGLSRERSLTP